MGRLSGRAGRAKHPLILCLDADDSCDAAAIPGSCGAWMPPPTWPSAAGAWGIGPWLHGLAASPPGYARPDLGLQCASMAGPMACVLTDVTSGFFAFRRDHLASLDLQSRGFDLNVELFGQALRQAWRVEEVAVALAAVLAGAPASSPDLARRMPFALGACSAGRWVHEAWGSLGLCVARGDRLSALARPERAPRDGPEPCQWAFGAGPGGCSAPGSAVDKAGTWSLQAQLLEGLDGEPASPLSALELAPRPCPCLAMSAWLGPYQGGALVLHDPTTGRRPARFSGWPPQRALRHAKARRNLDSSRSALEPLKRSILRALGSTFKDGGRRARHRLPELDRSERAGMGLRTIFGAWQRTTGRLVQAGRAGRPW